MSGWIIGPIASNKVPVASQSYAQVGLSCLVECCKTFKAQLTTCGQLKLMRHHKLPHMLSTRIPSRNAPLTGSWRELSAAHTGFRR